MQFGEVRSVEHFQRCVFGTRPHLFDWSGVMTSRVEKDLRRAKAILSRKNGEEVESSLIDTQSPKPNASLPRKDMYVSLMEGGDVAVMNPKKIGEILIGKQAAIFGLCPGPECNEKLVTSDVQYIQAIIARRGVKLECHTCGQHIEPMQRRIVSPASGGN